MLCNIRQRQSAYFSPSTDFTSGNNSHAMTGENFKRSSSFSVNEEYLKGLFMSVYLSVTFYSHHLVTRQSTRLLQRARQTQRAALWGFLPHTPTSTTGFSPLNLSLPRPLHLLADLTLGLCPQALHHIALPSPHPEAVLSEGWKPLCVYHLRLGPFSITSPPNQSVRKKKPSTTYSPFPHNH
jgi:hypothetical protein